MTRRMMAQPSFSQFIACRAPMSFDLGIFT
jgi:hypothetical protein